MNNIGIIDFKTGNIKSILQVFEKLSLNFKISIIKKTSDFKNIDRIILPGQGNVFSYMKFLNQFNLFNKLLNFSKIKPILGICVGKHIFFDKSEESNFSCLKIFSGKIIKFINNEKHKFYKIPHIGWNRVKLTKNHYLLNNIPDLKFFYFAHSYYLLPSNIENIYGITKYNVNLTSIYIKNNILLTQFHPEKSFQLGIKLCQNFSTWKP